MARKIPKDLEEEPITPDEVTNPPSSPSRVRLSPDGQTMLELPTGQEPLEDDEYEMDAAERLRRAIMLRLSGATFETIARVLHYTTADQAMKAINRAMKAVQTETLRDLKRIHHMRLEHMLMLLWPSINQQDFQSMAAGLQIMDRIERLHGLQYIPAEGEGPASDTVLVVGGNKEDFLNALTQAKSRQNGMRPNG
jgi:hypothetical protein